MTFLTTLFDSVKDIADSVLSKPLSLPLTLDEGLLNKLIDKLVAESGGPIESLSLSFYEGGFKAKGRAIKMGATVNVEADFVLSKLEISAAQQVLVLQRTGELKVDGENWWSKIAVFVAQAIVAGILRESVMDRLVGNSAAIVVKDPEVCVDLGRLGVADKAIEAVAHKWLADNSMAKALLQDLTGQGGQALLKAVTITGATCTSAGVVLAVGVGGS